MFKQPSESGDLGALRQMVDMLPSMLAYWDSDLRCRFANRAYQTWFGVDAEQLIGTHLRDLLGPTLFALNEPHIRAALAGEEQEFERLVPGPNGSQRHSLALYKPYIVMGQIRGFLVQVTDVSVLKRTEAALRAEVAARENANAQLLMAHQTLAEAQRLGQLGSWEWEVDGDRTTWSEQLFRLFGLDPAEVAPNLGEHVQRYTAESWSLLQQAVARALATGESYVLDLEFHRVDRTRGWLEARGEVVRDADHRIVKLRGTAMDITERRAARELRVQRDLAEQASRNKSVFLSRVSHELRTPLNGILGAAQLITAQEGADSRPGRWAAIIDRSGRDMAVLVDELLDLSAAELGQLKVNQVAADVPTIVRESIAANATVASAAQISLQIELSGEANTPVLCDPPRLRQVLNNLVSNAIKYNQPGGRVIVSVKGGPSTLALQVEDNGIGIAKEQLAQMFIPFNRLGAERTAVPGTGIGLALAKQLVELMGGSIQVDSELGKGTRFTFTLTAAAHA